MSIKILSKGTSSFMTDNIVSTVYLKNESLVTLWLDPNKNFDFPKKIKIEIKF